MFGLSAKEAVQAGMCYARVHSPKINQTFETAREIDNVALRAVLHYALGIAVSGVMPLGDAVRHPDRAIAAAFYAHLETLQSPSSALWQGLAEDGGYTPRELGRLQQALEMYSSHISHINGRSSENSLQTDEPVQLNLQHVY